MKFVRWRDAGVVLLILGVAFLVFLAREWLFAGDEARAEIYFENQRVESVKLTAGKERSFSVQGHENVVFRLYGDGSIGFLESDCPDKVCVRSGRLSRIGESAACLPNGLILKIVPIREGDPPDVDMVTDRGYGD